MYLHQSQYNKVDFFMVFPLIYIPEEDIWCLLVKSQNLSYQLRHEKFHSGTKVFS